MNETPVMEIMRLCRKIDETAHDVYAKFRDLFDDEQLSLFWEKMSRAEAEHVAFWVRAEQLEAFSGIPDLFERSEFQHIERIHPCLPYGVLPAASSIRDALPYSGARCR